MTNESPVFIVTGASRGLGYNIAEKLLSEPVSAKVVGVARSAAGMTTLKEKYPSQFEYVTGDLSDFETSIKTAKTAVEKFGTINGIVFNAAVISPVATVANLDINAFKKLFDINYFSILVMLKEAMPYLRKTNGKVVFVSSEASLETHFHGWQAYGSSKACLNHLAVTLTAEEPDIFAISIDPGVMDSAMQAEIRSDHGSQMKGEHHDYLLKIKEDGSIPSINPPATVISNLVVKGFKELNGQYLQFNAPSLSSYLS
ncbi:hypothetical protein V1511DRAFT_495004 [Dipodascopsis uninucleata]